MTSTAPAGLSDYVPDGPDEDDPARQRIEDWQHKRTRALAEGDWLPPPLLGGLLGWSVGLEGSGAGGDSASDGYAGTRSPFSYPLLPLGNRSYRHYRQAA